ncbi:hypothetical protein MKW92_022571 [Papaver armeniacum]|nr:hypothetical protein MKW92_022571 [Papaver armeniacum]
MASSSTLKPLPILPSSNSTLSSKSLKPSTIHFPSIFQRSHLLNQSLLFKEALDSFIESLDRESPKLLRWVAAGSEIHGTPKISIEDDCIDKIRIKLRSYYVPLIEKSCKPIMDAARTSNTNTMCPVYLPTKKFHIEIRTHQTSHQYSLSNRKTLESWMRLEFPPAA